MREVNVIVFRKYFFFFKLIKRLLLMIVFEMIVMVRGYYIKFIGGVELGFYWIKDLVYFILIYVYFMLFCVNFFVVFRRV